MCCLRLRVHKDSNEETVAQLTKIDCAAVFFSVLFSASMREDARKAGLAEGLAEGRSEGAAQEKREIAKSMKAKNIPTADIAEITSGSREPLFVRPAMRPRQLFVPCPCCGCFVLCGHTPALLSPLYSLPQLGKNG